QLRQFRDRAPELAAVQIDERLVLRVGGPLVEIQRDAEIAVEHVAGNVRDNRDGAAADIETVDRALVEAVGEHRIAGAVIRILADPARAQHAAIAYFEQPAFQMVRHSSLQTFSSSRPAALREPPNRATRQNGWVMLGFDYYPC